MTSVESFPMTARSRRLRSEYDLAPRQRLYEEYFAFGMTSFHSPVGTLDVPARRYRYNGKERDEETGLYYYGARYYAAWLGRWTSCDPSGADGPNRYSYVRNCPITLTDPNGEQSRHRHLVDGPRRPRHRNRGVSIPPGHQRVGKPNYDFSAQYIAERHQQEAADAAYANSMTPDQERAALKAYARQQDPRTGTSETDFGSWFLKNSNDLMIGVGAFTVGTIGALIAPEVVVPALLDWGAPSSVANLGGATAGGAFGNLTSNVFAQSAKKGDVNVSEALGAGAQGGALGGLSTAALQTLALYRGARFAFLSPLVSSPYNLEPSNGQFDTLLANKRARPQLNQGVGRFGVGDIFRNIRGRVGVRAELGQDNVLDLYIKTGPSTPSGEELFAEAFNAFGGQNIQGIRGTWVDAPGIRDNLISFRTARAAGASPEDAAFRTFTGKMAHRAGFMNVQIIENLADRVVVEFRR